MKMVLVSGVQCVLFSTLIIFVNSLSTVNSTTTVTSVNPVVYAMENSKAEIKWILDGEHYQATCYYGNPKVALANGIGTNFKMNPGQDKNMYAARWEIGPANQNFYILSVYRPTMDVHDNMTFSLKAFSSLGEEEENEIKLVVQGGPIIHTGLSDITNVGIGDSKIFSIVVSGNPQPKVKWSTNSQKDLNGSIEKIPSFNNRYRYSVEVKNITINMCGTNVSYIANVYINGSSTKTGSTTLQMRAPVIGLKFTDDPVIQAGVYKEGKRQFCVTNMKWDNDRVGMCKITYEIGFKMGDQQLGDTKTLTNSKSLDKICFFLPVDYVSLRARTTGSFSKKIEKRFIIPTPTFPITKVPKTTITDKSIYDNSTITTTPPTTTTTTPTPTTKH